MTLQNHSLDELLCLRILCLAALRLCVKTPDLLKCIHRVLADRRVLDDQATCHSRYGPGVIPLAAIPKRVKNLTQLALKSRRRTLKY